MDNKQKVLIVGLGHVGQPLAVMLAEAGFTVYGVDIQQQVIKTMQKGHSHVEEPGLSDLIKRHLNKRLFVGLPESTNIDIAQTIVLTVESDQPKTKRSPNLTNLKNAAAWVGSQLRPGQLLIVRSTVPVGVTRTVIRPILEANGLRAGTDFGLAFCPERTLEGAALKEICSTPQIVGGIDDASGERAESIFRKLTRSVVRVSSLEAAEAIKLIDNTYRDTRFAFANTIAEFCEGLGLDSLELIRSANCEYSRNSIPVPSPGVGGSCIPKDSRFLQYSARQAGLRIPLISTARKVNEEGARRLAYRLARLIRLEGATVFVAGFAYKGAPETSDMRGSPTLDLVDHLKGEGADVTGYDPAVDFERIAAAGVRPVKSVAAGLRECKACVFMTNHPEFGRLQVADLGEHLRPSAVIVDGWGLFDPKECEIQGFKHLGVGVGTHPY